MTPLLKPLCFLSFLLALASCSTIQKEGSIDIPSPAIEKAVEKVDPSLLSKETDLPYEWWKIFEDEQLGELIQKSLSNNPSFQATFKKIAYTAELAKQSRSFLFPTINYGADVAREKFSQTGIIPFTSGHLTNPSLPPGAGAPLAATGGKDLIPVYFTQYETEVSLLYDFDLWGKNRKTWESALSEVQSTISDHLFARLQLSIAVAKAYYMLQTDYQRERILKELVKARREIAKLTNQLAKGNLTTAFAVKTAETNLLNAEERVLEVSLDSALRRNEINAYLADTMEEDFKEVPIILEGLPAVPFPENLPMHLLSRRPDITAQLFLIHAAGKQIEVAKAGFYPDLNIFAFYGYQTLHLRKLFQQKSSFFQADPAITLPLFDGGRLQANLDNSLVSYNLEILKYNELVIQAVQEVLDGLCTLDIANQEVHVFEKAASDQKELLELTLLRIQNHLDSKINEWTRLDNFLEAQEKEILAKGKRIQATLALIKAIGGGYCKED